MSHSHFGRWPSNEGEWKNLPVVQLTLGTVMRDGRTVTGVELADGLVKVTYNSGSPTYSKQNALLEVAK